MKKLLILSFAAFLMMANNEMRACDSDSDCPQDKPNCCGHECAVVCVGDKSKTQDKAGDCPGKMDKTNKGD